MLHKTIKSCWTILSVFVIFSLSLSACAQPTPTNVVEPQSTQVVAPEQIQSPEPIKTTEPVAATEAVTPTEQPTIETPNIVVLSPGDFGTLDPHAIVARRPDRATIINVFDSLIRLDPLGVPGPEIATSWEMIDPTTWEFTIVEGAVFHNDEPINAEAVSYSIMRPTFHPDLLAVSTVFAAIPISDVKVVDDYKIQVLLEKPVNPDLFLFQMGTTYILPPKYYQEHDLAFLAENPVGSGPWKFIEWVKDDHLKLEAFDKYYLGAPTFDLTIRIVPEASSRLNMLRSGEADYIQAIKPDQAELANSDSSKLIKIQGLRKMHIGIELANGPEALKDVRVRHALNYAIDKQSIIDELLYGATKPMESYISPPNNNPSIQPYAYDPEKAMALLAEAGYPNGFEVTLQGPADNWGFDKEIMLVVASQLEQVGVTAKVETMDWGTFRDLRNNRQLTGLYWNGWAEIRNPLNESIIFTCGYIDNPNSYCNEEYDALLRVAESSFDSEEVKNLVYQMQEIIWQDAPWIFMWMLPYFSGVSNRFDFTPRDDGYDEFYYANVNF